MNDYVRVTCLEKNCQRRVTAATDFASNPYNPDSSSIQKLFQERYSPRVCEGDFHDNTRCARRQRELLSLRTL